MRRWPRRRVSQIEQTLARLDVTVDVLTLATERLEASSKALDALTARHLRALEPDGGDDDEA